jgi:hypothetical protein
LRLAIFKRRGDRKNKQKEMKWVPGPFSRVGDKSKDSLLFFDEWVA